MSNRDREFEKADRAAIRAAVAIERVITAMLAATKTLDSVARDYVVERLISELLARNPAAMDYLNKQTGEATMRVANALADWRDTWGDR
jgi:hypothetical protein